jgi:hypothetical protein
MKYARRLARPAGERGSGKEALFEMRLTSRVVP